MSTSIQIVYSCNDAYFDGLYLSILSIVRRTKRSIDFYLMSCDCTHLDPEYKILSKNHENILRQLVQKYNMNNSFTVINCKNEYDKYVRGGVNEGSHYSPYCVFRLFLDLYPQFNKPVIYLDVDTMALKDIGELYDVPVNNYDFGAVIARIGRIWQGPKCFNSGVLLLNMKKIIENNVFHKARQFVKNKRMKLVDQTALQKAKPNFFFLPGGWKFNEQKQILPDTVIRHFCGRFKGWPKYHNVKQWNIEAIRGYWKIKDFDEDYEIFLKDKSQWHKQ